MRSRPCAGRMIMPNHPRDIHPLLIAGALAAFFALLALVVLLALLLGEMRTSRAHIESQDAKVTALLRETRPLLRDTRPLVRDARALVEPLASAGGAVERTARQLPQIGLSARRLALAAGPVLHDLGQTDLAGAVNVAADLASQLSADSRAAILADEAAAMLTELRQRDLLARADDSAARVKGILKIQRASLEVLRRNLRVQSRILEIQVRALRHIRSLDRKTGGQLPPPDASP